MKDLAKNLQKAEFRDGNSEAFEQRCKALVHSSWRFSMHVPLNQSSNSNGVDVTMTHASNREFSALAAA